MSEFKTKDIYLSSALVALGYAYSLEKTDERFFFVFKDVDLKEVNNLVDKYWNKDLIVDAFTMVCAFKELKQRLFSEKDEN